MLVQKEEVILTVQLHSNHLRLVVRSFDKYFYNQLLRFSDLIHTTLFHHLPVS